MSKASQIEQLDRAVEAILAKPQARPRVDAKLAPLVHIARALRDLPRDDFRARLKADLQRRTQMSSQAAVAANPEPAVVPYLCVRDAAGAIEFYKRAFGAVELGRLVRPDGKIPHAQIQIGGATIMLTDENPDFGFTSPQSLGGAPLKIYLYCDDADAMVRRAVAAGAKIVQPVTDQFYGERSGNVADPFGYTWVVSTRREALTMAEIAQRFKEQAQRAPAAKRAEPAELRKGFRTVTPYLAVREAPELIEFVKQAFDAKGSILGTGSQGGIHAEYRIGDSMLMIGGGAAWKGPSRPGAIHLYVPDADAAYRRALDAGATSIYAPMDQPYGDREGGVRDVAGNLWFIATHQGPHYLREGMHSVTAYLFAHGAQKQIDFLKQALDAEEVGCDRLPDGTIAHAEIRIGDSMVELGEAKGEFQPMPSTFNLYVDDVDAWYRRAMAVPSAASISEPTEQPYGGRTAGVTDPFGNMWYMTTPTRPRRSR